MNNWNQCFREEELADYSLGRLSSHKQHLLEEHIQSCETCRTLTDEWKELLEGYHETSVPPNRVKQSLKIRYWFHRMITLRPRLLLPLAGAVALLITFIALPGATPPQNPNSGDPQPLVREAANRENAALLMKPQTVQYPVNPVNREKVNGFVWINNDSNEMLFIVQGVAPVKEKDYQVWFVQSDERSNAGLLRWENNVAHLYFQGGKLRTAENIAVSLEPKGGSIVPTGPDTMVVRLKKTPAK